MFGVVVDLDGLGFPDLYQLEEWIHWWIRDGGSVLLVTSDENHPWYKQPLKGLPTYYSSSGDKDKIVALERPDWYKPIWISRR